MTTSTNQMTLSELEKATQESTLTRWMYVLRRWPLIPFFILGVLVLCAIFSPLIAPYEPE